jgi:hypothetical protein
LRLIISRDKSRACNATMSEALLNRAVSNASE